MTWWIIAWNDLLLTLKDKMFFFWLLVFPLLFSLLFGMAFPGSSSRVQKATLNVFDKDQSFLSEAFIRELGGEKYQITLRTEIAGKLKTIPAGFNHTVPAAAVMFQLFNVLMYGGINLLQERRRGLLERLYLSPATYASILGGKWLSRVFLGMAQIFLLFLAGKVLFKTYWGPSLPDLCLVSLFFCGTIAGMSILLGSILRKEEVLIVLNILLANLMAALGGCWFPQELFPAGIKNVSYIFPTRWIMDAFHKLIFFGENLEAVLPHILVLSGFTLVFFGLSVKFFKLRKT